MHPLAESSTAFIEHTLSERNMTFYSIRIYGDYVGILGRHTVPHGPRHGCKLLVWSWKTGVQNLMVSIACTHVMIWSPTCSLVIEDLSTMVRSFVFLDNNFILGSSWAPPALLVYRLEQRPPSPSRNDTTQTSTHFLRFLLGTPYQGYRGTSLIQLASDPSPGWVPNARQVLFHIAEEERMIAMYSQTFGGWASWSEMSLIPVKALLRQIESLPPEEGPDVEWEVYRPWKHIEPVPEHQAWDNSWPYFVFGMRHVLPDVLNLDGKPSIIIRDLSQRRCLGASKEERKESEALYEAIRVIRNPTLARCTGTPKLTPRSILKCVPLPGTLSCAQI
jgi:hypothetical protein